MCMLHYLLSILIDGLFRNGHRLPAACRAVAVPVRPGCETWLNACRHDSFAASGIRSGMS